MPTEKQNAANRRNAKRSTGPKTVAGKAISSLNALTHGVLALTEVLLPWESSTALGELYQRMLQYWRPSGFMEEVLVEKMTSDLWKLRRLQRVESGVELHNSLAIVRRQAEESRMKMFTVNFIPAAFDGLPGEAKGEGPQESPEEEIPYPRGLDELGEAFIYDVTGSDALRNVRRYQTALENSLYKTIHELERRQAKRRGSAGPQSRLTLVS